MPPAGIKPAIYPCISGPSSLISPSEELLGLVTTALFGRGYGDRTHLPAVKAQCHHQMTNPHHVGAIDGDQTRLNRIDSAVPSSECYNGSAPPTIPPNPGPSGFPRNPTLLVHKCWHRVRESDPSGQRERLMTSPEVQRDMKILVRLFFVVVPDRATTTGPACFYPIYVDRDVKLK